MRKRLILIAALLIFALAICPAFGQAKSKSRNNQDEVAIKKITPRGMAYLLKPVDLPISLEAEYNLKTQKTGKLVVYFFKVISSAKSGEMKLEEIKSMKKVYPVKKGTGVINHVSKSLKIGINEKAVQVYTVISLVDNKGKELAFSTSKNFVQGTYRVIPEKKNPDGDYIREISVTPKRNSEIPVNKISAFDIQVQYSLKSKSMAYIDVNFSSRADMGTGRAWNTATFAVPKGAGKVIIKPEIFFRKDLAQKNMGIGIIYWLNPLVSSQDYIRIVDYFLR